MSLDVAPAGRKYVLMWLYAIAFLVLSMIILGGLTRLTGSGLSIVDWKPIMGSIPPLNDAQWHETFEKYKQFPEYQKVNAGMSLARFKFIFGMEFSHRLLGRTIGLVFFFPFIFFLYKRWLKKGMIIRGLILFTLGGLQGFMGWYMVKSGLVDEPRVSQYRLVAHLSLALLVYSLCLWFAFSRQRREQEGTMPQLAGLKNWSILILALVGFQITSGGFVAGLDAGLAFNTFPTMNGQWIPAGLFSHSPWFSNFFDNMVMVQFFHRTSAYLVTAAALIFFFRSRTLLSQGSSGFVLYLLPLVLIIQVILGITTLLLRVPVALGSLHQLGAVALWSVSLFLCHRCVHSG